MKVWYVIAYHICATLSIRVDIADYINLEQIKYTTQETQSTQANKRKLIYNYI